jgi:GNAT superfamily N-acetyltransferase
VAHPPVTVTLTEAEDEPAARVAVEGLSVFNEPFAGPHGYRPLNLVVRRAGEEAPAGGLIGFTLYRWLFIRYLYLPEDLRRGGLGAGLLRRAEEECRARGCIGLWLDTFDFQARPFYLKQGFVEFGTLPDQPPGHCRHFLMKRLDGGAAGVETHVPT